MLPSSKYSATYAPRDGQLVRRENFFTEEATPMEKANLALIALFFVLGLFLLILGLTVLIRGRGYRAPYAVLLVASLFYTFSELLDIPYIVLSYSSDLDFDYRFLFDLGAAGSAFFYLTDVFALAAALLLLHNRAAALDESLGTSRGSSRVVKMIADIVILCLFAMFWLLRVGLINAASNARYNRDITSSEYDDRIKTAFAMGYVGIAFFFFALLDLAISAFMLRSRIRGASDSPTNTVTFAVLPLFIIHWMYRTGMIAWSTIDYNTDSQDRPTTDTYDAIYLASTIQSGIFMAAIQIALYVVGCRRTAWDTFGNTTGMKPTVYPSQSGMYAPGYQQPIYVQQGQWAPQQQQTQWVPQQSGYSTPPVGQPTQLHTQAQAPNHNEHYTPPVAAGTPQP